MGCLAMARELQMTLLPSSEVLLTSPALSMDYHFKFAALTPFGFSTCAGHTTHSNLTGICCDFKRLKMLPAIQGLRGLLALPGLPQATHLVETTSTRPSGRRQEVVLPYFWEGKAKAWAWAPFALDALRQSGKVLCVLQLHPTSGITNLALYHVYTLCRQQLEKTWAGFRGKCRQAVEGFPAWKGGFQLCKPTHK